MRLKSPKAKGMRAEYFVRDMLRGFDWYANRMPGSGAFENMKGDIISDFPFFLEVKNTAKTTFAPWYEKASDQSGSKPPMIVWLHEGQLYSFALFSDILQIMKSGQYLKQQIPKPPKKKEKVSLEDTSNFMFSKAKQVKKP